MPLTEKLQRLESQMTCSVIKLETDLYLMRGAEAFSGSLKGVSAFGALQEIIEKNGESYLEGKVLLDASSGNFARALAFLAQYLHLDCEVIVSTKATETTKKAIQSHGAAVTIGGDTTLSCYETAKQLKNERPDKYILVGQLDNWGNPAGHYTFTGPQILKSVADIKNVFMAMGSGGGVSGVTKYLQEVAPDCKVFASIAEPGNKIVGTFSNGIDYETPFIKLLREKKSLTKEIPVNTDEAQRGMIDLSERFGVLAGYSAGGVYSAYQKQAKEGLSGPSIIMAWDHYDRWLDKL